MVRVRPAGLVALDAADVFDRSAGTSDSAAVQVVGNLVDAVAETLAEDLEKIEQGTNRDEVKWTDVAVHASVEPEPFGTVVAEAMIAGVAVVATKGGGVAEYVQPGRPRKTDRRGRQLACSARGREAESVRVSEREHNERHDFHDEQRRANTHL